MGDAAKRLGPLILPVAGLVVVFGVTLLVMTLQPERAKGPPPPGMIWIPGGRFVMGAEDPAFGDAPEHDVIVSGFHLDETEVTNAQFAEFVKATNYLTTAERKLDPNKYPQAPPERLEPWSFVFSPPREPVSLQNHTAWWKDVQGANWRQPEGPKIAIQGRENHPVVHVSWEDASAYARWAGKRLPTEAEWEYAARGGLSKQAYTWGDQLTPAGKWQANIWQGEFPRQNLLQDGHYTTAPVKSFPPNGFGLHDMAGNVWEWCADWYRPDAYKDHPLRDPKGPASSHDPQEPGVPKRVQRGGSYLCSDLYCVRYKPAGRGKGEVDGSHAHVGFRCAK